MQDAKLFEAVVMSKSNGLDVSMHKICGYKTDSLNTCEQKCAKYYSCDNVAYANDILTAYENKEHFPVY